MNHAGRARVRLALKDASDSAYLLPRVFRIIASSDRLHHAYALVLPASGHACSSSARRSLLSACRSTRTRLRWRTLSPETYQTRLQKRAPTSDRSVRRHFSRRNPLTAQLQRQSMCDAGRVTAFPVLCRFQDNLYSWSILQAAVCQHCWPAFCWLLWLVSNCTSRCSNCLSLSLSCACFNMLLLVRNVGCWKEY